MKKVLAGLVLMFAASQQAQSVEMPLVARRALVNQYCVGCHNDKLKSGGFSFTTVDLERPDQSAAQFEKVSLKLRTGMMPPAGRPRPTQETIKSFTSTLEAQIDRAAAANPNPGRPYLHRLN